MGTDNYFSEDYSIARRRFREGVARAKGQLHSISIAAKGPDHETLTMDIAWFGTAQPSHLLLHTSGLHGVEAFAGSAIQLRVLDDFPALPSDVAVVLGHVLNPYGMAWLRRFNENNVDLNRNFLAPGQRCDGSSEAYAILDRLLNPASPPSSDFFLARAAWAIVKHGMPALRQAVGGGQYDFPRGIMFGGRQREQGPREFEVFLVKHLNDVQRVIAIDVHTGLGRFGEDTLLVDRSKYGVVQNTFGGRVASADSNSGTGYEPTGTIEAMLYRLWPNANVVYACQEFGTVGPLRIVSALRQENRWHHYGVATTDHVSKQKLKQAFCPDSEAWQTGVLKRGCELFHAAFRKLAVREGKQAAG
jgi:hypothetical protein